jgi:GTPase involved in cell partitioning and DNA repair
VPVPSVRRATGGNGGAGGNVYIVADKNVLSLALQVAHFNAEDGSAGGGGACFPIETIKHVMMSPICATGDTLTGRVGKDRYVRVPLGTVVTESLDMTDYGVRAHSSVLCGITCNVVSG